MKCLLLLTAAGVLSTSAVLCSTAATPLPPDTSDTTTSSLDSMRGSLETATEPFWGRIYLRHGVAPIQYFRDSFGGPMVQREVEFYFPRANRFGCDALEDDEHDMVFDAANVNRSVALVVDRGECSFEAKSRVAEAAGVAALVVVNSDESVVRPTAQTDNGEIRVPSVMVRKSAGDMLRATILGAKERVFGRLLPMVCTSNPYACAPRTKSEQKYMKAAVARSGVLVSSADHSVIGEFLASTFGGVMPQRTALPVSALLHSSVVCQNADTEKMPRLDGKVALIAGSGAESGCSVLDMVTHAQASGSTAALIVTDSSASVSSHASVQEDWLGYNVTIFSAVISSPTMLRLVELQEQNPAQSFLHFELKNEIADAWEQIHRLSAPTAWPARRDRKDKLLKVLLQTFVLNDAQTETLKSHYLTVAGGSLASWDALAHVQDEQQTANAGAASGGPLYAGDDAALAAKLTGSAAASTESRDEL